MTMRITPRGAAGCLLIIVSTGAAATISFEAWCAAAAAMLGVVILDD